MTEKKRIGLPSHLGTRDATNTYDGVLKNFYEEDTPIGKMIVKRPGMTDNVALGACVAQGSTFFNNNNYFICSNVLYVNPVPTIAPICPSPGGVTTWASGLFATIDSISNYVWISDAAALSTKVYDPTDQSLKATIPIPGGAAGGPGGISYLPSIRAYVTGSNTALPNPDVWVIDAVSYAITHSIDFSGGSGYVPLFPAPIPFTNTVVVYNNNGLGGAGNFSFDIGVWTGSAANPYPVFSGSAPSDFLPIPDLSMILYTNGSNIWIVKFGAVSAATTYSTSGGIQVFQPTYDPKRKRIWYVDGNTKVLTYIDLSSGSPGTQVSFSTLPEASAQICYDKQRDVIWITCIFTGNVLKVDPSTGTVLTTMLAKADGVIPSNNVGSRLYVWKNCYLLQNSGSSGSALRLIPIQ